MSEVEVAVGAVVRRDDELLVVRRGHGPAAGQWSVPGGRVRFGEDLREAVVREVLEETGIEVVVERFLGWVERIDTAGDSPYHFVILDFLAVPLEPEAEPVAGDDAAEADWVALHDLTTLALVDGLAEFLEDVGILTVAEEDAVVVLPAPEPPTR
jgi:8-oxo-dGTP diphosphatase